MTGPPRMWSIVVPTYDRETALTACLDALAATALPAGAAEVIVVDDGSPRPVADGSRYERAGNGPPALPPRATPVPATHAATGSCSSMTTAWWTGPGGHGSSHTADGIRPR